jgi:hypothetical protein
MEVLSYLLTRQYDLECYARTQRIIQTHVESTQRPHRRVSFCVRFARILRTGNLLLHQPARRHRIGTVCGQGR